MEVRVGERVVFVVAVLRSCGYVKICEIYISLTIADKKWVFELL